MKYCITALLLLIAMGFVNAQKVGIQNTNPQTTLDISGDLATRAVTLTLPEGNLISLDPGAPAASYYRIEGPTLPFSIAGIQGGVDGKLLWLHNVSTTVMTLLHDDAGGLSGEKLKMAEGKNLSLASNGSAFLMYDSTSGCWRMAGHTAASFWLKDGNAGTNDSLHFIGTTDNEALSFRIQNMAAGRLDSVQTFLGKNAGANFGSGIYNVAIGNESLVNNVDGSDNTALGAGSLYFNNASQNTAIGRNALHNNQSGTANTAIGNHALYLNTNRSVLLAVGDSALYHNGLNATENYHGTANTAIGVNSLNNNTIGHDNTAIGYQSMYKNEIGTGNTTTGVLSLYNNTTGHANTAIGYQSLANNTTGNANTSIGHSALISNQTGISNTAVGYQVLYLNNTGQYNVGMGAFALGFTSGGSLNTGIGYSSMFSNQNGTRNTAFGSGSLYANVNGVSNVAIGANALRQAVSNNYIIAIGDSALYSNGVGNVVPQHGSANTAVGSKAMFKNTLGYDNTALGYQSLYNNIFGLGNSAMGVLALHNNNGNYNTGIGYQALSINQNGSLNTAVGGSALRNNTQGSRNVAVGTNALFSNNTGTRNTAVGDSALVFNESGSYNTAIGQRANNSLSLTNSVAVGYFSYPNNDNVALLGNTATASCGGYTNWTNFSDGRFKKNVKEEVVGLAFIKALRPVTYQIDMSTLNSFVYKADAEQYHQSLQTAIEEKERTIVSGFIAQEVASAAQKVGYYFDGVVVPKDQEKQHYQLSYASFVVPLVKAVQEQEVKISELENKILKLEKIAARLEELEKIK
ncbi:MAG TPA: tail fiber domain-containing protein [Saprospiraceae bacterium]|nr:tail fiber domain-containing protein [Saprospiraceae bacterium]